MFGALKGLTPLIDFSVVHWLVDEQGWSFAAGDGVVADPIGGMRYLHEVRTRSTRATSRFLFYGTRRPARSLQ
jgi:putative glutathione S-transferase